MARSLCKKSIKVLIGTSRKSSSQGSSARGGRYFHVEGGGSVHPLCPAGLDGDRILCDLRECFCVVGIFADRPLNG